MWDHIINIHPSKLLSTKTKESKINELKKMFYNHLKKYVDNLHFIPNNILTIFFKDLTKYKSNYQ